MIIGNRFFITDEELGLIEVSQPEFEFHKRQQEKFRQMFPVSPKIKGLGKIFVSGTTSDIAKSDFHTLFFNSPKPK